MKLKLLAYKCRSVDELCALEMFSRSRLDSSLAILASATTAGSTAAGSSALSQTP